MSKTNTNTDPFVTTAKQKIKFYIDKAKQSKNMTDEAAYLKKATKWSKSLELING